jgi:hypothetical protein
MRKVGLTFLFLALGSALSTEMAVAQQAAKPPDFSGVWQRSRGAEGAGPQSEWFAGQLPFTPKGLAMFLANKPGKGPRLVAPVNGNDPIGGANPAGLYRALIYQLRPMEMVQTSGKLIQLFEWGRIFREVYFDGRPVPDDVPAGPFWYGYSVGHWEGDTLVVSTVALDERAWMDEWGTPFTADTKFMERWRKTAPNKLELKLTVTDPVLYDKPWTSIPVVYTLQPKGEVQEVIYAPMDEQVFNDRIRNPAGTSPSK